MKDQRLNKLIIDPVAALIALLTNHQQMASGPLMMLVFDEASNLSVGMIASIRRLFRLLRTMPIWGIFLSTYNCTPHLQLGIRSDSSARIRTECLKRHHPFLGLQLDVELNHRLSAKFQQEMGKPLSQFATPDHLTLFGRPLWRLYANSSLSKLQGFVEMKILGGTKLFNPLNRNHVFAVLASRICLDACTHSDECTKLVATAVHSHLRLVVAMDEKRSMFTSITPSEPIVAHAAASLLMERDMNHQVLHTCPYGWSTAISTLTNALLYPGLVEKGLRGELFARIIFVVSRDILLGSLNNEAAIINWSSHFSLLKFFGSLLSADLAEQLENFKPNIRRRNADLNENDFATEFSDALANFNHFTTTSAFLAPELIPQLLHDLLRQCAGLQLCFTQPAWDLLFPTYHGSLSDPFDQTLLSAVVVQVKNTKKKNTLRLGVAERSYFARLHRPVIGILLDLGSAPGEPQFQYIPSVGGQGPPFWGIHLLGCGAETFGALLDLNLAHACRSLLRAVTCPESDTLNVEISRLNARFNFLALEDRFPGCIPQL